MTRGALEGPPIQTGAGEADHEDMIGVRTCALGGAVAALLAVAGTAQAQLLHYRWVDDRGMTRRTARLEDIPGRFRAQAAMPAMPAPAPAAPTPAAPAATPAVQVPAPAKPSLAPGASAPLEAPRRTEPDGPIPRPAGKVWQVETPDGFVLKTIDREKCERMAAVNSERHKRPVVCAEVQ